MAATLLNAADLQFGVDEDEAGILIESVSRAFNQKEKTLMSKQGETIGLAMYDKTAEVTVNGLLKSSGALATLALGALGTLANASEGRGVTGGSLVLKTATETEAQEDFMKVELRFTRYPLIPAT